MSTPPYQSPDGSPVVRQPVDIEESNEKWSEVLLGDGTRIRIKVVLVSAQRLVGVFDANNNPAYEVSSQIVTAVVSSPESLRKQS